MIASRKLAYDKDFKYFHKKAFLKNTKNTLQSKRLIALNLYIDINELV